MAYLNSNKSPDGRNFGLGLSLIKYRVGFAYALPTPLDAFGDETVSDMYKTVLLARARYYTHQFKEDTQAAAFALEDCKRGLRLMRLLDGTNAGIF